MRLVGQLVIDQLARVGADPLAPVEQALWRPFAMRLVRGGHVLALGAVGAATAQRHMAGPRRLPCSTPGVCRQPHLDALPGQGGGHAVEAAIDLDVVVDADLVALEGGDLVGMHRQRSQGWAIQALEPVTPAAVKALERPSIQVLQQLSDGLIECMQAEELPMAQPCHDPALDDLHRHLGLGLGFAWPRRQHYGVVMAGALQRRPVQARLVPIRQRDQSARIVRHDHLRHAAEVGQRLAQRSQPVHLGFARRTSPVSGSTIGSVGPA